jgi:hypothetical protein
MARLEERKRGATYDSDTPRNRHSRNDIKSNPGFDLKQPPVKRQNRQFDRRDAEGVQDLAYEDAFEELDDVEGVGDGCYMYA